MQTTHADNFFRKESLRDVSGPRDLRSTLFTVRRQRPKTRTSKQQRTKDVGWPIDLHSKPQALVVHGDEAWVAQSDEAYKVQEASKLVVVEASSDYETEEERLGDLYVNI